MELAGRIAMAKAIRRISSNAMVFAASSQASVSMKNIGRIMAPQVGDIVVETSTINRSDDLDAVGYLEAIDGDRVQIRTFDGRLINWSNASFIAAPTWNV